jgi:F-type H+-transporting ATPase subunit delta
MIDNLSPARPYAKAIFALALHHDKLHVWAEALQMLALIAEEAQKYYVLKNPKFRKQQKINLFLGPAHDISTKINFPDAESLLRLLLMQKRLVYLPQICKIYHELLNDYEQILDAKIVSAVKLSAAQRQRIIAALEKRYQKKISLGEEVNPKLIGGAIIYAGDRVHDGSISGRLAKLKDRL